MSKVSEAKPPPKAVTFTSDQQYCSRCHAPIADCYECGVDFTENATIYCDDGRHIHTFCLTKYLEDQP